MLVIYALDSEFLEPGVPQQAQRAHKWIIIDYVEVNFLMFPPINVDARRLCREQNKEIRFVGVFFFFK